MNKLVNGRMNEISYEDLIILACLGLPPELEVSHNGAISTQ